MLASRSCGMLNEIHLSLQGRYARFRGLLPDPCADLLLLSPSRSRLAGIPTAVSAAVSSSLFLHSSPVLTRPPPAVRRYALPSVFPSLSRPSCHSGWRVGRGLPPSLSIIRTRCSSRSSLLVHEALQQDQKIWGPLETEQVLRSSPQGPPQPHHHVTALNINFLRQCLSSLPLPLSEHHIYLPHSL
ncbi:unnamed protein product [Lota lota]